MAKKPARFFAVSLAATLFGLAFIAQPAVAAGDCNTKSTKTKTTTTANSACTAQARIYRYVSSYPTAYDGPKANFSKVTASNGTEAGHATRTYYGGGWTWWYNF